MAIIFSDTLFSVEKVSNDFTVKKFELYVAMTDEVTYISSGPFFDWLAKIRYVRFLMKGKKT